MQPTMQQKRLSGAFFYGTVPNHSMLAVRKARADGSTCEMFDRWRVGEM